MAHIVTQRDIDLLYQHNLNVFIKLELLNKRFQVVDELQGECINAQLSLQSSSDVRRTCTLTMHVDARSYDISSNAQMWLDKMIQVFYGIYDPLEKLVRYYPMGIFLLMNGTHTYDTSTNTLSLSLLDLMSMLTSDRGSAIGASEVVVEVNSNIRNAIISTLTQFVGWDKYNVTEFNEEQGEVPYDLEFETGIYPHDIIAKLRDLYPCYETFFDTDGTFICRKIPTSISDDIILPAEIMDRLLISSAYTTNISNIKNATEVWGMSLEADRWSEVCTSDGDTYLLEIPDIEIMDSGVSYGFTVDRDSNANQKIQINGLPAHPIFVEIERADGTSIYEPIEPGTMKADVSYVLYYSDGRFLLQGELEIHVLVIEVNKEPSEEQKLSNQEVHACSNIQYIINPESPFAADREDIGIIKQVFRGGEYDNISTTKLAYDRAAYENWKATRLQETATVDCILVPWLDANQKIEYTSPQTSERIQNLVDGVTFDFSSGTMTMTLTRFYPYYPWLS